MAPFQRILELGRMGHATVNPRLKDEKDTKKKRREKKEVIFFPPEFALHK